MEPKNEQKNEQETETKQQKITELNKISEDVQGIFFRIKKFKDFDLVEQAQKNVITLMENISKIQRAIISEGMSAGKEGEGK